MAGRTLALVSHIPGNVLAGNFRVAVYLDEKASAAQEKALLDVYTGKLGGPIADFAKLVGEVVSVERTAITFDVQGGMGTLKVGEVSMPSWSHTKAPMARPRYWPTRYFQLCPAPQCSWARRRAIARSTRNSAMTWT